MHYHVVRLTQLHIELSLTDIFLKTNELQDKFSALPPINVRNPEAENCLIAVSYSALCHRVDKTDLQTILTFLWLPVM
jgi:hypothetical protein